VQLCVVSIEMIAGVVILQDKLEKMHLDAKNTGQEPNFTRGLNRTLLFTLDFIKMSPLESALHFKVIDIFGPSSKVLQFILNVTSHVLKR